jgi:hypothetical protein
MDWLPPETAKRDGSRILADLGNSAPEAPVQIVYWSMGAWCDDGGMADYPPEALIGWMELPASRR